MTYDLKTIVSHFDLPSGFRSAVPYGTGHINDTYSAEFDTSSGMQRFIIQRINHLIFKDPDALMENIDRVSTHQRNALEAAHTPDPLRRALTLAPTRDGHSHYRDDDGNTWRVYFFIEGARTYDIITGTDHAFQAARAFGTFQAQLANLPAPALHETIPGFHHTPKRFQALEAAISADPLNRAKDVKPEIDFALSRKAMTTRLMDAVADGRLPLRVTHNDTKLNNVMIDDNTQEGICVIDLDTVMPGLVAYDFGDMVRTAASPAAEDERDLSQVTARAEMVQALVSGYLEAARDFLNADELDSLIFGGTLMTFENAIRFLTDHLMGDVYYKTHREGHNLDRCRAQIRLIESLEEQEDVLNAFVRHCLTRG